MDDWRGVGEPLNETGQSGDGLIVRGKHYLLLNKPSKAAYAHRTLAEEVYMTPAMMITKGDSEWREKFNTSVSTIIFLLFQSHFQGFLNFLPCKPTFISIIQ